MAAGGEFILPAKLEHFQDFERWTCAELLREPSTARISTAAKAKRMTHRSSTGKKLYAVRDETGKFKDIQTYQRAHAADLRSKSEAEKTAAAKKK
jgi:hypothetical protein